MIAIVLQKSYTCKVEYYSENAIGDFARSFAFQRKMSQCYLLTHHMKLSDQSDFNYLSQILNQSFSLLQYRAEYALLCSALLW